MPGTRTAPRCSSAYPSPPAAPAPSATAGSLPSVASAHRSGERLQRSLEQHDRGLVGALLRAERRSSRRAARAAGCRRRWRRRARRRRRAHGRRRRSTVATPRSPAPPRRSSVGRRRCRPRPSPWRPARRAARPRRRWWPSRRARRTIRRAPASTAAASSSPTPYVVVTRGIALRLRHEVQAAGLGALDVRRACRPAAPPPARASPSGPVTVSASTARRRARRAARRRTRAAVGERHLHDHVVGAPCAASPRRSPRPPRPRVSVPANLSGATRTLTRATRSGQPGRARRDAGSCIGRGTLRRREDRAMTTERFVEPAPTPLALLLLGRGADPDSERGVECPGDLPAASDPGLVERARAAKAALGDRVFVLGPPLPARRGHPVRRRHRRLASSSRATRRRGPRPSSSCSAACTSWPRAPTSSPAPSRP